MNNAPVVVELFESQGCSSCPPAEEVLHKLHQKYGAAIIPIVYHVDYWDYLGWKDVFSDPQYTERQKDYGHVFGQSSIYTPEMVVQGEAGFVGSDYRTAEEEIERRFTPGRPTFLLQIKPNSSHTSAHLSFNIPPTLEENVQSAEAMIIENAPAIHVLRGENTGTTMSGDFAVRQLLSIHGPFHGRISVDVPLTGKVFFSHLKGVVLLKNTNLSILAAQISDISAH